LRFFYLVFMAHRLLLQLYFVFWTRPSVLHSAILRGILGLGFHYNGYNAYFHCHYKVSVKTVSMRLTITWLWACLVLFSTSLCQAFIRSIPQLGNNMILMVKVSLSYLPFGVAELVYAPVCQSAFTFDHLSFFNRLNRRCCITWSNIFMELAKLA